MKNYKGWYKYRQKKGFKASDPNRKLSDIKKRVYHL